MVPPPKQPRTEEQLSVNEPVWVNPYSNRSQHSTAMGLVNWEKVCCMVRKEQTDLLFGWKYSVNQPFHQILLRQKLSFRYQDINPIM